MAFNETAQKHAERLLLAMVPMDEVIDVFRRSSEPIRHDDSNTTKTSSTTTTINLSVPVEAATVDDQDAFASLVDSCWNDSKGPSQRYLKAVVKRYVALLEKDDIVPESEGLLDLVLRVSLSKDGLPQPGESCYLSFCVPTSQQLLHITDKKNLFDLKVEQSFPKLYIQVYPYHNDISLRLWEAGTFLAEYFLQNPSFVAGKKVVELGAGVGFTGLVVAGCCNASSVHLTDYTEACRINLQHNLNINKEWLLETAGKVNVSQGYLEWNSFAERTKRDSTHQSKDAFDVQSDIEAFFGADVLIAADVVYDPSVIPSLVAVLICFLFSSVESASDQNKHAIFGITRRNMDTFILFLASLKDSGVCCHWLANSQESPSLRRIFPRMLHERNCDVRVAKLSIQMNNSADS